MIEIKEIIKESLITKTIEMIETIEIVEIIQSHLKKEALKRKEFKKIIDVNDLYVFIKFLYII